MLVTDGLRAFKVKTESREKYFNWVDGLQEAAPKQFANSNWDVYSDPIIIIHDMTAFSKTNQGAILAFMALNAKDVTAVYTED